MTKDEMKELAVRVVAKVLGIDESESYDRITEVGKWSVEFDWDWQEFPYDSYDMYDWKFDKGIRVLAEMESTEEPSESDPSYNYSYVLALRMANRNIVVEFDCGCDSHYRENNRGTIKVWFPEDNAARLKLIDVLKKGVYQTHVADILPSSEKLEELAKVAPTRHARTLRRMVKLLKELRT